MRNNLTRLLILLFLVSCGDSRLSPQGGTITSVQGGSGLTGGGTGGAVTLNVGAGTGIIANANDIAIDTSVVPIGVGYTTNTLLKATGAGTIGNTAFPITDGATALTIGDSQSADVTTINGRVTLGNTASTATGFDATWTPVGGTTNNLAAIKGTSNGSINTTGSSISTVGVYGVSTSTESAGSNTLSNYGVRGSASGGDDNRGVYALVSGSTGTNYGIRAESTASGGTNIASYGNATGAGTLNYGGYFTATGAGTNRALYTADGDVLLNDTGGNFATDGNATLGDSTSGDAHTINGRISMTSTWTTSNAFNLVLNPTVATASRDAFNVSATGTYDTTSGNLQGNAINVQSIGTKSAGGNTLINNGIITQASGAQDGNRALRAIVSGSAGSPNYGVFASNTSTTTTNYGVRGEATGAGTTNIGGSFTGTGATNNVGLETISGYVRFGTTAGDVGVGLNASANNTIHSLGTLFANTVPKVEIQTGTAAGTSYNEAVVIRHNGVDGTAQTRRLGFLLKLNNESSLGESSKMGGLVLESTQTFANAPSLYIVTADTKRMNFGPTGTITIEDGSALRHTQTGTTDPWSVTMSSTGQTGTRTALIATRSGSSDTTAGDVTNNAILANASSTESAGGNVVLNNGISTSASAGDTNRAVRAQVTGSGTNNFGALVTSTATGTFNVGVQASATGAGTTNYGGFFTATGAGTNFALYTDSGDVILNDTNGTFRTDASATIGDSTTSDAHTVNGTITVSSTAASTNAGNITYSGTSQTATRRALNLGNSGTFDTTAGTINSFGVEANVTSTRSAGANNLVNIALLGTASGAQVNRALQTNAGDVLLNATSGNTQVNGNMTIGDSTSSDVHTFNGRVSGSSSDSTANALTFSFTPSGGSTGSLAAVRGLLSPSGGTASNWSGIRGEANGTMDTTAGSLVARAVVGTISTTRSAGSNNLTNVGGQFNASGAQVNIGIQTDLGDNYLNASGGFTGVGYGSGTSLPAKLSISGAAKAFDVVSTATGDHASLTTWTAAASTTTGLSAIRAVNNGTFNTTSGALETRAFAASISASRSSGANNLTNVAGIFDSTGAQVNIALQTANGSNYFNANSGNSGFGYTSGATLNGKVSSATSGTAFYAESAGSISYNGTSTMSGRTTSLTSALLQRLTGTFDTTSGNLTATGISVLTDSTRSAGANNLTNVGMLASASGAQINIALQTDAGDVVFNAASGSIYFGSRSGPLLKSGTGTPEGAVTAPVGSMFLRTDGGAGTSFYIKESGTGNTGWVAK